MSDLEPASDHRLITRRKLLQRAGATGVAVAALYVAPSFASTHANPAYASVTGAGSTPLCDLCEVLEKPSRLTMQYTGSAFAGTHSQDSGKVNVDGDPAGASPVYIIASDHDWDTLDHGHTKIYFPASGTGQVSLNGTFAIDAAIVSDSELKSKTFVHVYSDAAHTTRLQSIEFHTSCSQPLFIGDGFGTLLLRGFVDKNGVDAQDVECESSGSSEHICDGAKLATLTMTYNGGNSDNVSHSQDSGKVSVVDFNGGPSNAGSVFIRSSDEGVASDTSGEVWFEGVVTLGSTFVIDSAPLTKIANNTFVHVFSADGTTLLQTAMFHTSCSQPLSIADIFGASTLTGFTLEP